MQAVVIAVVTSLASVVRSRMALQIEVLALRHQLAVYQRAGRRPQLRTADRILWAWLSRAWSGWREALVIVQPRTVISWQRKRFREYWTRLSRQAQRGRPSVAKEIRDLIRKMSAANPTWGSPRIMGVRSVCAPSPVRDQPAQVLPIGVDEDLPTFGQAAREGLGHRFIVGKERNCDVVLP